MPERTKILDVSERRAFRTIYGALNWCVGTEYRYWGKACWPKVNPNGGFRMWFTQLAYIERGKYVPAAYDCINILCCNGNYHVFDKVNPKGPDAMDTLTYKYDLIFSKELKGMYYFRGVFIRDCEHTAPHHYVSKRIATKVKLIGCPAHRLELLDSVNPGEFDVNYLKKHVVSLDAIDFSPSFLSLSNKRETLQSVPKNKPKAIVQEPVVDYQKMFPNGCRIKHKSFGIGVVMKVDQSIITVNFKTVGKKDLGAEACVKMNLIERI